MTYPTAIEAGVVGRQDRQGIEQWIQLNRPAGIAILVNQVKEFPFDTCDPEERALAIPAALDLLEDTNTCLPKLLLILDKIFSDTVYDLNISSFGDKCSIYVKVNSRTSGEVETGIRSALDLMLYCEINECHFSEAPQADQSVQIVLTKYTSPDTTLIFDNAERILCGGGLPDFEPLPDGSSVILGGYHTIQGLSYMLSMFDNVYIKIPKTLKEFHEQYGYKFEEFLEVLPSQRLIPMFFHQPAHYNREVVDAITQSEVRRILHRGEIFLRALHASCTLDPLLSLLASYDEDARRMHAHILTTNDSQGKLIKPYFEYIGDCISRIRRIGKSGESAILGDFSLMPYAFVEHIAIDRLLTLSEASFYAKLSSSLGAVPVCIKGHPFENYLDAYYALARTNDTTPQRVDPHSIGEIMLIAKGIPLRDLIDDFNSDNTRRMRELMSSPRLLSATNASKIIEEFNLDAREFNGRWKSIRTKTEYGITVSALVLAGLGHYYAGMAAITVEKIIKALPKLAASIEKISPRLIEKMQQKLTGSTREGVALAKLKVSLDKSK